MDVHVKTGLSAVLTTTGAAGHVGGDPPFFDLFSPDRRAGDHRAPHTADRAKLARFNQALLRRGAVKAVNKIYVSLAHSDADVDETLGIFDEVLACLSPDARP